MENFPSPNVGFEGLKDFSPVLQFVSVFPPHPVYLNKASWQAVDKDLGGSNLVRVAVIHDHEGAVIEKYLELHAIR